MTQNRTGEPTTQDRTGWVNLYVDVEASDVADHLVLWVSDVYESNEAAYKGRSFVGGLLIFIKCVEVPVPGCWNLLKVVQE